MVKLVSIAKEDRDLFWNINQKYLYEMTNYYNDPMDENGNYHYGHFDEYFIDENRKAFFIYDETVLVGFLMLNNYSYFNFDVDYVLAEFTIFPYFRRNKYASEAINILFKNFKGNWEIKYNINNTPALNLWEKVTEKYNPKRLNDSNEEVVLIFNNRG